MTSRTSAAVRAMSAIRPAPPRVLVVMVRTPSAPMHVLPNPRPAIHKAPVLPSPRLNGNRWFARACRTGHSGCGLPTHMGMRHSHAVRRTSRSTRRRAASCRLRSGSSAVMRSRSSDTGVGSGLGLLLTPLVIGGVPFKIDHLGVTHDVAAPAKLRNKRFDLVIKHVTNRHVVLDQHGPVDAKK